MNNIKVLTLANEQTNRWIQRAIGEADFIDLTCATDMVDAVSRLKREKFDAALVDARMPDLAVTCYRINSLHATPLALLTHQTSAENNELRHLDANRCIPRQSNSFQLLHAINHLSRESQPKTNDKKTAADILLVGDDPAVNNDMRTAFRYYWPEARISAIFAGQPEIKMPAEKAPDVTVLDIGLKEAPALNFLKRLRSMWQSPIIILTNNRDETLILTAARYGADDYLMKPVRKVELIVKTRECLKRNHIRI